MAHLPCISRTGKRTAIEVQIEIKVMTLRSAVLAVVLGLTLNFAPCVRSSPGAQANNKLQTDSHPVPPAANSGEQARQGRRLFSTNCAHCHGDDARGDEGPTLYDLALSDARIAQRIKDGIKGEMPRFGSKLNDMDIAALIAYLRTLQN